jgi:hypothetical protein
MSCNSSTSASIPSSSFPNASTMETLATNLPVVWEEICAIQQAILAASSQCSPSGGQMCTTVGGTTPMTFVSGVTSVTVVNGGSGYYKDTPAVKFIPPNGSSGSGATATATTNGGAILSINMTAGGTGYQPVNSTMSVTSLGGTGAVLQPLVDSIGAIVNINIANAGSGYTINDTVTATRAVLPNINYVDATFKITSVGISGDILAVAILNPGSGYQPSVAQVEIVSSLNNALPYPVGSGFQATVLTDNSGVITQVVVNNSGAGYADVSPFLVISNPGSGADTTVNLTGTSVSSIAVNKSGSNYVTPITGTVFNPSTATLPNPPTSQAVVTVNISTNTYGTTPSLYWQVWAGTVTNKAIQLQLNQVLSYFQNLNYTIQIQSNPQTGSTIQWKVCW